MATEILRPNGVGSETALDIAGSSPAATNWESVDEVVADDGVTIVRNTTSDTWKRDLYALPAPSGSGTINKITVYFRCTASSTSHKAKASIKSNGTVTDGVEKTFSGAGFWYDFSQVWATNPADSGAWEWPDINNLEIGVYLYSGTGRTNDTDCTIVYVEIDYEPPAAGLENKSANMAAKMIAGKLI